MRFVHVRGIAWLRVPSNPDQIASVACLTSMPNPTQLPGCMRPVVFGAAHVPVPRSMPSGSVQEPSIGTKGWYPSHEITYSLLNQASTLSILVAKSQARQSCASCVSLRTHPFLSPVARNTELCFLFAHHSKRCWRCGSASLRRTGALYCNRQIETLMYLRHMNFPRFVSQNIV